jgi:predicted AAA+ superfamily ATPase
MLSKEDFAVIKALQKRGVYLKDIAAEIGVHPKTVRRAIEPTARLLLDRLTTGKDAVFIDEIQRLENPGLTIKILVDLYPRFLYRTLTGSGSG